MQAFRLNVVLIKAYNKPPFPQSPIERPVDEQMDKPAEIPMENVEPTVWYRSARPFFRSDLPYNRGRVSHQEGAS